MRTQIGRLFALPLLLCQPLYAPAQDAARLPWPHAVPCRIHDGKNNDLFLMALGNVETAVTDGVFDPVKDEVRLKDGTLKEHYFRDVLGLKFY